MELHAIIKEEKMGKVSAVIIAIVGIILLSFGVVMTINLKDDSKKAVEKTEKVEKNKKYSKLDNQFFNYLSAKFYFQDNTNYWIQEVENVVDRNIYIDYVKIHITSELVEGKDIYNDSISVKKTFSQSDVFEVKAPIVIENGETFVASYEFYGKVENN